MGLSCKVYGKYESFFKKLDNKLKADREAIKQKGAVAKSKKDKKAE